MAAMRAGSRGRPFVMQADVENSDNSTAQTIEQMALLIKESIEDPLTRSVADRACQTWGQGSSDPRSIAWACWWYAKHSIKFVLDGPAARNFVGLPEALELLISPALMLRTRKMQGDCDDFTMMICALLGCCGLGYEIITVAANPREPGTFSHVYCRAVLPDGSRVPLDATPHGKYPGWQIPSARVSRLQAWDEDGNPVPDQGSNTWDGLHGYTAERGLGACGDCNDWDEAGNCIGYDASAADCGGTVTPASPITLTQPSGGTTCLATNAADCPPGTTFIQGTPLPGFTATPTLSTVGATLSPFETALASLLSGGAQIASSALKPATPAGTVNIQTSSLLLYAGLAVAALFVLSVVSKK
jgi:hypothetical protein